MRTAIRLLAITCLSLTAMGVTPATASDTVSCNGKRAWQQQIVQGAVQRWFQGQPDPEDLVSLVQAEHGIVACTPGPRPQRIHTTTLPRGMPAPTTARRNR